MKKENAYDFQKRMLIIHQPNLRDHTREAREGELFLPEQVTVAMPENADMVIRTAVEDFADFLKTSMSVSAQLVSDGSATIQVALAKDAGIDLGEYASYKGFRIDVTEQGICVYGHDARGIGQGLYYLEDLMRFERAPAVALGSICKKPLFYPQMIHSGYYLDEYPDEYLARVAHEGRDAILLFVKDVNLTPCGHVDFNDLIRRAAKYGLDVYAYSYLKSSVSPLDPKAEEYYEGTYGKLFRECPGLKGVTLVGESVEFPSTDPHVSPGTWRDTVVDGIPTGKPSSGWYPCEDYPVWLNFIKKIIRKYNPEADIVFWSYNWGSKPEDARVKLIESLPKDISLQATFEMYEQRNYDGAIGGCDDYTLAFAGPGEYFKSEAVAAAKNGIPLYSMANSGGLTWDLGVIPYEPMPYQWMRRFEAMRKAHDDWGLQGIMESHHFGFYPSFISKLGKHAFLEPREDLNEVLKKILISEFGAENYAQVDEALKYVSEAITHHTPSDSDQYGAFRVGPSFPFCLIRDTVIPSDEGAHFGSRIVENRYYYTGGTPRSSLYRTLPLPARILQECASLEKMLACMEKGVELLYAAPVRNEELDRLTNLCHFIRNCVQTGLNAKRWSILLAKSNATFTVEGLAEIYDEMDALIEAEREVVKDTFPLVEADSRLGWEPSMLYMTDRRHLEWKLRQLDYVRDCELANYRNCLKLK